MPHLNNTAKVPSRKRLVEFSLDEVVAFFEFLDDLRESGETNMFGAAPWVQREFGLDRLKAKDVLVLWMETFDPLTPARRRAEVAWRFHQ